MNLAIESLKLFLSSLPEKSLFNIYSFGSTFKAMFDSSAQYNDKTLHDA